MTTLQKADSLSPHVQEPQSPEPQSQMKILHERFSILSLLLTLVTTLNYGHPTLEGFEQRSNRNRQQNRPHIMEALLAILVMDTQILACMTYGNGGVVIQKEPADRLTGDEPADEQYHVPEGKLFQIATINNGQNSGSAVNSKPRQASKDVKQKIKSGLNRLLGKKPGGATQDQIEGQEAGGATKDEGQLQEQEAGGATKDQVQLQEQDVVTQEDQVQKYTLVKPGEDLWTSDLITNPIGFKGSKDFEGFEVSFRDHITTVCTYLERYREEQDQEAQMTLRGRFSEYLILACWPKMLSRAKHWAIVGLLRQLALIPYQVLLKMEVVPSTEPDRRLAQTLINIKEAYLNAAMSLCQPPGYTDGDKSIPALLSASKESRPLYTKNTAIEFHRLLVGVLLLYAQLIAMYAKTKELDTTTRFKIGAELGLVCTFLHTILYSDTFNCHVQSLVDIEGYSLTMPMSGHFEEYRQFAEQHNIHCQEIRVKQKVDKASSGSSKGGKKKSGSSNAGKIKLKLFKAGDSKQAGVGDEDDGSGANADTDGDKIPDATSELDDRLPPSVASLESPPGHKEVRLESSEFRKMISSWLKLLVKYHTAQGALESYCRILGPGGDPQADIKLLDVKPRQGLMPIWGEITLVVASILEKTERPILRDAQDMIGYITKRVRGIMGSKRSYHNIINKFWYIIQGDPRPLSYTVHCEAALVAFASEAENMSDAQITEEDPLCKLRKQLDRGEVAVSKLCCPACWELIHILQERSGKEDYNVYGCHSTVYPVQLPPGLPIEVLTKMTEKFEDHLDRELSILQKKRLEHSDDDLLTRVPSRQSVNSHISNKSSSFVLSSLFPRASGLEVMKMRFK